jgi:tripartite-type tricarboxylate transporter receptor subunit TctC
LLEHGRALVSSKDRVPQAPSPSIENRDTVCEKFHHQDFFQGYTMKLPRRQFLHVAAGAAALPAMQRIAGAQTYPTKPVRLIVAFAAGGPNDIVARLIGQWLTERMGQPLVVENRPGGGGSVGTEALVRSPPDGHTLLLCSPANTIGASFYEKLSYNFLSDTAPVALVARTAGVMETHPSVPAKTVPEFIAYAKANPGKINMASSGTGTFQHVTGSLFKAMTGVDLVHVPYRGAGPALNDLLGGQVQVFFDTLPSLSQTQTRTYR